MTYRIFKLDKNIYNRLSEEDKRITRVLGEVVKDIALVYNLQLKEGFYPKGVTKEELEKAGKEDPKILSSYTYITRRNGSLEATPYYEKYASYLVPIAQKIEKAANLCSNVSFKKYLQARARSLLDDSYEEADIAWFNVKRSDIDFNIGPFERYLDTLLFTKRAYQAHVGIINKSKTFDVVPFKEALYTSAKLSPEKYHSTNIPKTRVDLIIEDTPLTSGFASDVLFSGEHFPTGLDLMQKIGSKIIIYRSQLELKFERLHYPIFKKVFEKRFAAKYSKQLLLDATLWYIMLYELVRQLHKFESTRERLKELYGIIDEANGFASGIQHSKSLFIKGLISQEMLEAIIIIHIIWMFADWLAYKQGKGMKTYVLGDAMALNYHLSQGSLKELKGIYWPNFAKVFFEIETLADIFVHYLRDGSYEETEKYIKENSNLNNLEKLSKNILDLKLDL